MNHLCHVQANLKLNRTLIDHQVKCHLMLNEVDISRAKDGIVHFHIYLSIFRDQW